MNQMEANRLKLQALLEEILGSDEVYFQRPDNRKMSYPAIVYSRENIDNTHADNRIYKQDYVYSVLVIDPDPDSAISDKVSRIPRSRFVRNYTADHLNHDLYTIYF